MEAGAPVEAGVVIGDDGGISQDQTASVLVGVFGPHALVVEDKVADGFACAEGELEAFAAVAEIAAPFAGDRKTGAVAHFESGDVVDDEGVFTGDEAGDGAAWRSQNRYLW